MNDLEYLNQISAKPVETKPTLFDKKTKIIAIIAGAVLLLAIIIMAVASSSGSSEPTEASELSRIYHRSVSLEKTINTYQKSVKSSDLRSSISSLATLITELKSTSNNYLTKTLGASLEQYPMIASDSSAIDATDSALEKARQNGILDRKIASEFYYQISHLIILEESVEKKTGSSDLQSFLSSSRISLSRLSETFYAFSESK